MSGQVLSGTRVLDFGRFIAGPSCAALLGDLGADVIRVEKRNGGEDRWVGPVSATGEGAMYLQNNRNKRSITLDPAAPGGAEVVRRLIEQADVVVANLPARALAGMGLSYEQLRFVKPDIILVTASAYGTGGPYSQRLGFDAVGQVFSGSVMRTGTPQQPVRSPVPYIDHGTALASAVGVLAAIIHRQATGEGQHVETSLLSTALMFTSAMLIEQFVLQSNRVATLNRGQQSAPNDIFAVADGWVLVQVVGDPIFRRWCRLLELDDWLSDARFVNDRARGEHWQPINAVMAEWCAARDKATALAELEAARVPAYPVNTLQDALNDPHVAAMGYLKPTAFPGLPVPAPLAEAPVRLSATPLVVAKPPPQLGQHTEQVLLELGYGLDSIERLRVAGAV